MMRGIARLDTGSVLYEDLDEVVYTLKIPTRAPQWKFGLKEATFSNVAAGHSLHGTTSRCAQAALFTC